jgi:hypothetical protein
MIKRFSEYLWIFALLIVVGLACNFSTARIADAQMAKEVDEKTKAIKVPASSYETSDKLLHCVVKLANAPTDTKLRARWVAVKSTGMNPGEKIDEVDIAATSETIDFTLGVPNGLPPGDYRVEIFLNPDAKKEAKPAKTVNFTVNRPATNNAGDSAGDNAGAGNNNTGGNATITRTTMALDANGENLTDTFAPDTTVFYCLAQLKNSTPATKVTFKWMAVNAQGVTPNSEIDSITINVEFADGIVRGKLTPSRAFPQGEYRVDLFVNDSPTPNRAVPFFVK